MSVLVKDGALVLEEMEATNITKQQLYAMLREKKVHNLGKVKRAYLKVDGDLTVYTINRPNPGLPILPPSDRAIKDINQKVTGEIRGCCNWASTTIKKRQ